MRREGASRQFRPGELVFIEHLHTEPNRVRHETGSDAKGRTWCKVEGKARRMIILRECWRLIVEDAENTRELSGVNECVWYRVETRRGYWVLSVASTPPRDRGYIRCPGLIHPSKDSYVTLEPVCYPTDSISHGLHQRVDSIPKEALEAIYKELGMRVLGLGYYRS